MLSLKADSAARRARAIWCFPTPGAPTIYNAQQMTLNDHPTLKYF